MNGKLFIKRLIGKKLSVGFKEQFATQVRYALNLSMQTMAQNLFSIMYTADALNGSTTRKVKREEGEDSRLILPGWLIDQYVNEDGSRYTMEQFKSLYEWDAMKELAVLSEKCQNPSFDDFVNRGKEFTNKVTDFLFGEPMSQYMRQYSSNVKREIPDSELGQGNFLLGICKENGIDLGAISNLSEAKNMIDGIVGSVENPNFSSLMSEAQELGEMQSEFERLESLKPEGYSRSIPGQSSRDASDSQGVAPLTDVEIRQLITYLIQQMNGCMGSRQRNAIIKTFTTAAAMLQGEDEPYDPFNFPDWFPPLLRQSCALMDYCSEKCFDIFQGLSGSRGVSRETDQWGAEHSEFDGSIISYPLAAGIKENMSDAEETARWDYYTSHNGKPVPGFWKWDERRNKWSIDYNSITILNHHGVCGISDDMSEEENRARMEYYMEYKRTVPQNWFWGGGQWCIVGGALSSKESQWELGHLSYKKSAEIIRNTYRRANNSRWSEEQLLKWIRQQIEAAISSRPYKNDYTKVGEAWEWTPWGGLQHYAWLK